MGSIFGIRLSCPRFHGQLIWGHRHRLIVHRCLVVQRLLESGPKGWGSKSWSLYLPV